MGASYTVVEDTLWVMGGMDLTDVYQSTQVVRQGQPTEWGPNLTVTGINHCATTLQDNSVILTGGWTRSNRFGSARTEIYNSTTKRWERKADMRQRRVRHSCTNVWLEPDPSTSIQYGVIARARLTDRSVLSVVVAGGKMILYFTTHSMPQDTTWMRKEGSTTYTVWRCTCPGTTPGWNSLPSLS